MKIVKTTINCQSNADNKLTIVVGNGQVGQSSLKKPSGEYVTGDIQNVSLGSNIAGKTVFVSTMVTDVNPNTNQTSVSYYLNQVLLKTVNQEADEDHSSVLYKTKLVFS